MRRYNHDEDVQQQFTSEDLLDALGEDKFDDTGIVDRSELYAKKYPALKPMKRGSHRGLFGNGAAAHHKPLVTREPKEVLTGVSSFSETNLGFLSKLSEELNKHCPVDLDSEGFTRSGVHSTFDRLRVPAGYMMNPMSYVAVDNKDYIEHLGLKPKMTADEIAIGEELWRIVFSEYLPSPIKVTKRSAGGPRRNTSDHEWKKAFGEWVLQPEVLAHIMKLHSKKDWLALANTYEMVFLMYAQKRDQTDVPGKVREVMDLLYALSGGKEGKIFPADKDVVIEGRPYPEFSASRARFIHSGPWAVNVILSMISTGTMQSIFMRFPKVFHVNTDEQIKATVDGNYAYCGDVKEYDRSMKEEALRLPHRVAREFWAPELIDMSEHLYFSAYYARPLSLDGDTGTLVGDYTSFDPQVICGNRSGHAWTSLVAKVNKVWETLCVFHSMGLEVKGNVRTYLEARAAINLVNNGDDEIVYTKSKELMDKFVVSRADLSVGNYAVSREDGAVFSGRILRVDDNYPLEYFPCSRLPTAFEKIYCPERSIGGLMRPYWWVGVTQRINSRDEHPTGGKAWEIHDRLYRDIMERSFGSLYGIIANAALAMPLDAHDLTIAEKEVLDDPSKLYYKYADGDIRKEIVAISTIHVPVEAFIPSVKAFYTGKILIKEFSHV